MAIAPVDHRHTLQIIIDTYDAASGRVGLELGALCEDHVNRLTIVFQGAQLAVIRILADY